MRLSIIMPVYRKPPELLRPALESVLAQTERDFELIAVNDCSPDDAGTVLAEYAARDSRVKVLTHAENRGVSAARNTALAAAAGEYFGFVDADDRIVPEFYATLLAAAERTRSDMVIAEFYQHIGVGEAPEPCSFALSEAIPESREPSVVTDRVIWNRVYRRRILGDIRFDETISHCEDLVYVNACSVRARRILSIAYPGYGYCCGRMSPDAALSPEENYRKHSRAIREYLKSLELLTALRSGHGVSRVERKLLSYLALRRALRFCTKTKDFAAEHHREIWGEFARAMASGMRPSRADYPVCMALASALFHARYMGGVSRALATVLRMVLELSSTRFQKARSVRKHNLRTSGCDLRMK